MARIETDEGEEVEVVEEPKSDKPVERTKDGKQDDFDA
jgi:hypothetical protein